MISLPFAIQQKLKTIVFLVIVSLFAFWYAGCARQLKIPSTFEIDGISAVDAAPLPIVTDLYGEASRHYKDGLAAFDIANWQESYRHLEMAVNVLSEVELEASTDPEIVFAVEDLQQQVISAMLKVIPQIGDLSQDVSMATVESKLEREIYKEYGDSALDTTATEIIADTIIYDIPLVYNKRVEKCVRFFKTTGKKPFRLWLKRKGRYEKIIQRKLRRAGLPQNLIYLAMIESGFNPNAYSRSHAVGIWQFISSTAKIYGMTCNWWIDERRDFEIETDAAIAYLKNLYDMFGDWHLAMAGYNAGENRIRRALVKSKFRDFWNLPKRSIKPETRNYVPKMIAATLVCKNLSLHGFDSIKTYPSLEWDTVVIHDCISLEALANCAETSLDTMKLLNPSIRRWCTPPYAEHFSIRVPKGRHDAFWYNYRNLDDRSFIAWKHHTVRKNENLISIARRYHTRAEVLMAINGLRGASIRAGRQLIVPGKGRQENEELTKNLALVKTKRSKKKKGSRRRNAPPGTREVLYKINAGDFLGKIAETHGVTVSQLKRWNNLGYRSRIYAGKMLLIYAKPYIARRVAATSKTNNPSKVVYTIQRGDNLWTIAKMFNTSVNKISKWNGLKAKSKIRVGQKLTLWTGSAAKGSKGKRKVLYEVRKGDTVTRIAKTFSVAVNDVLRWNNLGAKSLIRPGNLITLWIEKKS